MPYPNDAEHRRFLLYGNAVNRADDGRGWDVLDRESNIFHCGTLEHVKIKVRELRAAGRFTTLVGI